MGDTKQGYENGSAVGLYKFMVYVTYRQTFNICRTLAGNKIVDHSYVVGAAPTTSSFSTEHLALLDWAKATLKREEKY